MRKLKLLICELILCCAFGGLIGFYILLVWKKKSADELIPAKEIEKSVKIYKGKWYKNYLEIIKENEN